MHFLRQLCKHSATTKMTEKNCAIVFAPTLMYPAEQTIEAALDATRVNDIVEALITHAHLLKEKKQGSQVNK
jgi:RhoGAP domain